MSDQNFPMPKSLDAPRQVPGFDRPATPPPPSDYAPKRGLEAVAQAIEGQSSIRAGLDPHGFPKGTGKLGQHTQAIRESIKLLTHREMREMVAMIFEAQKKLGGAATDETITRTELADVLDRFAYGE